MNIQNTYGRRCGRKLRSSKKELLETLLPKIQISLEEPVNIDTYKECFLEIGFGAGEHLALQAEQNPETLMIGCEPFINGVANLLEKIQEGNLTNIRIYPGNALRLLEVLPDHFLNHVFLLFPDPWPKKAHHKRRFVQKENLDLIVKKLAPEGKLLIATDHADYFEWILERVSSYEGLVFLNPEPKTWTDFPELWTQTRFQDKAIHAGRESRFLWFRKA